MSALIALSNLTWSAPDGRPLLSNLGLSFDAARTGLVGRHGVGKATLREPASGNPLPAVHRETVRSALATAFGFAPIGVVTPVTGGASRQSSNPFPALCRTLE
jgi:ABC-type hemin transport system ATPase subunit